MRRGPGWTLTDGRLKVTGDVLNQRFTGVRRIAMLPTAVLSGCAVVAKTERDFDRIWRWVHDRLRRHPLSVNACTFNPRRRTRA